MLYSKELSKHAGRTYWYFPLQNNLNDFNIMHVKRGKTGKTPKKWKTEKTTYSLCKTDIDLFELKVSKYVQSLQVFPNFTKLNESNFIYIDKSVDCQTYLLNGQLF